MNEKNLVICDPEIRYANRLGENISQREELAVKVHICSSFEKLKELSEKKPIHILVLDETYAYEERRTVSASQIFVLSEGNVKDLGEAEHAIGKYRCADEIIREIFEVYVEKTKENMLRNRWKNETRLIAVYSPIHRIGKTTFAMELGRECAKSKRVLYLNMEECAGFQEPAEKGWNLGDLLYYIKQGDENLGVRMQLAVQKSEGLDYLLPVPISTDLKGITMEEWESLLGEIVRGSNYELLILDMSESVQGLFQILESCDRIYMPVLSDEISERKLEQYEKNLAQLKLEKLANITYRFVMPEQVEEYARMRAKEEC